MCEELLSTAVTVSCSVAVFAWVDQNFNDKPHEPLQLALAGATYGVGIRLLRVIMQRAVGRYCGGAPSFFCVLLTSAAAAMIGGSARDFALAFVILATSECVL
jgi:hypothetical protein